MSPIVEPVESLFAAAVALPADERAAYLDQACDGDEALRTQLDALLRAHERAGRVIDRPPHIAPERTRMYVPDQPGAIIAGRYKLLEPIGEGGMGAVWVAEQREPVKRLVAVKLIKPGMDSKAVLARFDAERQALALMDHPNIAKVFDGGTTDEGRPYFVMELVKGLPLTEYCDARRLNVRDRLELFALVCSAVQHAHQKGVIHRDLKPSNVLVTEHDGKPVPKVIDFGLAKALNAAGALTDKTLHTAFGSVVGTPLYMAPEQVGINALDVDTRTDVYALGVILYELLTGSTPLEKKRLHEAAWDEMRRLIREVEPPRPSFRLSTSDALPSLAANRQIEPTRLSALVRGELDWIVMKALEKDRNRRYETANGFAMDVRRHLAGEPVSAVPPSMGYRMRKFIRRNQGPVLAAASIVLLLIAGVLGTTIGLLRAVAAEKDAVAQAAKVVEERDRAIRAEAEARDQGRAAEQQKARANEKAEVAEAVSDFLRRDILAATPFQSIGRGSNTPSVTVIEAVDRAAARVGERFTGRPLVEAAVRATLGNTLLELHRHEQAEEQLEQAVRLFRAAKGDADDAESLRAMLTLAWLHLTERRLDKSERLHADLVRRAERSLPEGHGLLRNARAHYAQSLASVRKFDVAEPLFQSLINEHLRSGMPSPDLQMIRNNLALMYQTQGRTDDAERLFRLALEEHRRLTSDVHPNTVLLLKNLAAFLMVQGRNGEAVPLLEEAVSGERKAFGESRPKDLIDLMSRLCGAYGLLGRFHEAGDVARRALALDPRKTLVSSKVRTACLTWIAHDHMLREEFVEAETAARECLAIRLEDDPRGWTTSNTTSLVGETLLRQKKFSDAEPLLRKGFEGLKQQEKSIPPSNASCIPDAIDRLIDLYTATNKPDELKEWKAERAKYPSKQPAKK